MELWFTEKQTQAFGITAKVRQTLTEKTTEYQHLAVLDTEEFGRMLVLDGMVQTTVRDEFVYHEMISHPAMLTHPNPRRVAVIGGGDGGAIREVLKHDSVERAVLVEIDGDVIDASREFLPEISSGLSDPRVEVLVADGLEHVRKHKSTYDVILVDSTEPVGAAIGLFSEDFYRDIYEALTSDGVLAAQTESPFFNQDIVKKSFRGISRVFPCPRLLLASVPTYPSGLWSFTIGSKSRDPLTVALDRAHSLSTRYYSASVHRAAFQLPPFVESLIRV